MSSQKAVQLQPAIVWHSDPVKPDETVLLSGAFAADATVELCLLENRASGMPEESAGWESDQQWQAMIPLQAHASSLAITIPASWPAALYGCRAVVGENRSAARIVNRPEVWWTQGDDGTAATRVGGVLRVLGNCLNLVGNSSVVLESVAGGTHLLEAEAQDAFSLSVRVPADLPPGQYGIWVHNGLGGPLGWHRGGCVSVSTPRQESEVVLDAVYCGADPTGMRDSTLSIVGAIERLGGLGGGTLYFPRGRYRIESGLRSGMFIAHPLRIPAGVKLRGEKMELVSLYWPEREEPLPALIEGGDHFGVEELTIYTNGRHRNVISGESHVRIHRVRIRANCYYMLDTPGEKRQGRNVTESHRKMGSAIELWGQDVQVTECDIYHSGDALCLKHVRGGLIAHNRLRYGANYASMYGGEDIIFEHNDACGANLTATGGTISLYFGAVTCRHYYFGHNNLQQMYGGDREALTFDGHGTAYIGGVESCQGQELVLDAEPSWGREHKELLATWRGCTLYVADGAGAGQWRKLVACEGRRIRLESPLDVPVDDSSTVTIGVFNGRHILVHNTVSDAGSTVQLYPPNCQCIVAHNTSRRAGNFNSGAQLTFGMPWAGKRVELSWYNQFLDNQILEGNGWAGGPSTINGMIAGEAKMHIYGSHTEPEFLMPINRWQVVRNHVCANNSSIDVQGAVADLVVENCTVRENGTGVQVIEARGPEAQCPKAEGKLGKPQRILLRNNVFENVTEPYSGSAVADAQIHPALASAVAPAIG